MVTKLEREALKAQEEERKKDLKKLARTISHIMKKDLEMREEFLTGLETEELAEALSPDQKQKLLKLLLAEQQEKDVKN